MNTRFLVGSRAFFSGIDGFKSDNRNFLKLVENQSALNVESKLSIHSNITYRLLREPARQMIERVAKSGNALLVGNFLVPKVARAIGATVADLQPLEPLLENLQDKHKYQAVIFRAYQASGSFSLTDEQRQEAYEAYCQSRKRDENEAEE